MIGRIHGILIEKKAPQLIVDVHGVGYEIDAPMSTFYHLPDVGQQVTLITHLVVREDAHILYGFATQAERALFRALIKINGVGAKMALALLSGISPEEFVALVHANDTKALVKLPGVGKKTAERLVIEMRDRLDDLNIIPSLYAPSDDHGLVHAAMDPVQEAVSALIALGYKPPEASRMIQGVDNKANLSSQELIRQALQTAGQS